MNDLDEEIRKVLSEVELQKLDAVAAEPGLFAMLGGVFTGKMRFWTVLMSVSTFVFFIAAVWMGWQFMHTDDTRLLGLYGFGIIIAMLAISMLKLWLFMEMNKYAIVREVKRVELQIAHLSNKLDQRA